MKNVRNGVFETNSSSSHSISICADADGIYDTIVPDSDGVIVLAGGEYGWEWVKYNDPLTKANYSAVDQHTNHEHATMLKEVIKEHTGAKVVVFAFSLDWNTGGYSYIDHDSVGTAGQVFESKETLKNYLFSPKSWLYLGNDNEPHPPNFFDAPGTVYKYELSIEGLDITEKFVNDPKTTKFINEYDKVGEKTLLEESIDRLMQEHPLCGYNNNSYDDRWTFQLWGVWENDEKTKKYSSKDRLDQGEVVIFRLKRIYNNREYVGQKIVDQKVLKFHIKEI